METETLTATERTCKDCGAPLGAGREDRQYCDSNCKTNYNNRKRREIRKVAEATQAAEEHKKASAAPALSEPDYISRIQEILLNNRRILESLCSQEKPGHIRMRDLQGKGFNKKFMTSVAEPTATGRVYIFCFEFGYYEEEGKVTVVRRGREVD